MRRRQSLTRSPGELASKRLPAIVPSDSRTCIPASALPTTLDPTSEKDDLRIWIPSVLPKTERLSIAAVESRKRSALALPVTAQSVIAAVDSWNWIER